MMRRFRFFTREFSYYLRRFGLRGPSLFLRLHFLYRRRSLKPVFVRLDKSGAGIWIRPGLDLGVFQQVFVHDEYGFEWEVDPVTIIDAGANIGCASVYLARRFPEAQIVSVEPMSSTFDLLQRNLAPFEKVKPLKAALWFENTTLEIADESVHHVAIQVQPVSRSGGPPGVRGVTVETIAEQLAFDRIDLLKVDIEGAEDDVFEHAGGWLSRVQSIVIEFHDTIRPGSETRIRATIKEQWAFEETIRGENVFLKRISPYA